MELEPTWEVCREWYGFVHLTAWPFLIEMINAYIVCARFDLLASGLVDEMWLFAG
jgi:hypothetical protein